MTYEYTISNILLRCNIFLCIRDALKAINNKCVYVNGVVITDYNTILNLGDCIQLNIFWGLYKYIKIFKKFLKKKAALFKHRAWRFYKQKDLKKKDKLRWKKRRNPKYLFFFFFF